MEIVLHDRETQPFAELVSGFRKNSCNLETERGVERFRSDVGAADARNHTVTPLSWQLFSSSHKSELSTALPVQSGRT